MATWKSSSTFSTSGIAPTTAKSVDANADGSITITNPDGTTHTLDAATYSGIFLNAPLTTEENSKLEDLKTEREKWIKSEKLKNFQNLPVHLRQEIVDEACVFECLKSMDSIDTSKFEGQDEIGELETKNDKSKMNGNYISSAGLSISPSYDNGSPYAPNHNNFKYGKIIHEFTKEELMEAHAAATMEESLEE